MHDASRRVLHFQETVELPLRSAVQEAVAIIDPYITAHVELSDIKSRTEAFGERKPPPKADELSALSVYRSVKIPVKNSTS